MKIVMIFYISILGILVFPIITNAQTLDSELNLKLQEVAPNMPERPEEGSLMDHPDYRMAMDKWVADYPHEFEKAVALDASLNIFAPPKSRDPRSGDRPLSEPPLNFLPPFMKYPVNESKPVFIDNHNPDYDSLVYKRKLQHWYYLYDTIGYLSKYGPLPDIADSIKGLTHPDQFAPEVDTGQYLHYYPEFE